MIRKFIIVRLLKENQRLKKEEKKWRTLAGLYHDTVWELIEKYDVINNPKH